MEDLFFAFKISLFRGYLDYLDVLYLVFQENCHLPIKPLLYQPELAVNIGPLHFENNFLIQLRSQLKNFLTIETLLTLLILYLYFIDTLYWIELYWHFIDTLLTLIYTLLKLYWHFVNTFRIFFFTIAIFDVYSTCCIYMKTMNSINILISSNCLHICKRVNGKELTLRSKSPFFISCVTNW